MPTSLGHALGGLAACALVGGRTTPSISVWRWRLPLLWFCVLLSVLPDVDLLLGKHRGVTHTIGATVVVGVLIALFDGRRAVWFAGSSAYGTHVLLDWLGTDTSGKLGVMALWPFNDTFYLSSLQWFQAVCRQYWCRDCLIDLAWATWWELLLLGPPTVALLLVRRARIKNSQRVSATNS